MVQDSAVWSDGWGKPFGAASWEREWQASTSGRPSREAFEKRLDAGLEFIEPRKKARLKKPRRGAWCAKKFEVQPCVRVKAYAHDRLSISIFDKYPAGFLGKPRGLTVGEIIAGGAALVKPRETRRGFKIGGRWRFRPPCNRFTTTARNTVMDAAHIIEHRTEGQGLFVTLTMAGGTRQAYACMGAASGYVVDRMNRWLRYKVESGFFAYVWELQQRGAPHIHYIFRVPNGVDVDDFGRAVQSHWRKILLDVSVESGIDVFARLNGGTWRDDSDYPRCDTRRITFTYASYIAKYASKNRTKGGASSPFRPGRWWGVSYAVRKEIRKRRLDVVFPVRSRLAGIALAKTLIEAGGVACTSHQWLKLPPYINLAAVSIFTGVGAALDVAKSLLSFIDTGDFSGFARVLKSLNFVYSSA